MASLPGIKRGRREKVRGGGAIYDLFYRMQQVRGGRGSVHTFLEMLREVAELVMEYMHATPVAPHFLP